MLEHLASHGDSAEVSALFGDVRSFDTLEVQRKALERRRAARRRGDVANLGDLGSDDADSDGSDVDDAGADDDEKEDVAVVDVETAMPFLDSRAASSSAGAKSTAVRRPPPGRGAVSPVPPTKRTRSSLDLEAPGASPNKPEASGAAQAMTTPQSSRFGGAMSAFSDNGRAPKDELGKCKYWRAELNLPNIVDGHVF